MCGVWWRCGGKKEFNTESAESTEKAIVIHFFPLCVLCALCVESFFQENRPKSCLETGALQ